MHSEALADLPYMVYADKDGKVYDHPHFRMVGFSGSVPAAPKRADLMPMPSFSKLFFIPECAPMGIEPVTGEFEVVREVAMDGVVNPCYGVAAFLEPGLVRTHLPALDYGPKSYTLPTWAYAAVGYRDGQYWTSAFRIEYNEKWDPRNYDDKKLIPAIYGYERKHPSGRLLKHLIHCATVNHCFAAKNLFLERWEAPLPVSRTCNAECLGCLSLQPASSCEAAHQRISFTPTVEEIVEVAVPHLSHAPEAIVSFGQGCEGEPLAEYRLIAKSIREIRKRTDRGTINLNTNGSWPERIREIAESGLDSIRISLNSAQPGLYEAYYRPRSYDFEDVLKSATLCREMGLYTMINYLVFPGVTDQKEEMEALAGLLRKTKVNFLHLKNLNIDPQLYLTRMARSASTPIGMRKVVGILREEFPEVELGYFNRAVR